MRFIRTPPPVTYSNYRSYREYTREVFRGFCAYCFRHEDEVGGPAHFDQDHFVPRAFQPELEHEYTNLYWCCKACNGKQNKGEHWPTPEQHQRGECFVDPCETDPFGADYYEKDGVLLPLTSSGDFTIRHIRLNRDELVNIRRYRLEVRSTYQYRLEGLKREIRSLEAGRETGAAMEAGRLETLQQWIPQLEAFIEREPFTLSGFPILAPGAS